LNSWQQQQINQSHLAPIPARSGLSKDGYSNSNFNRNSCKMGKTGFTAGSFPVLQAQGNYDLPLVTEMCRQKKNPFVHTFQEKSIANSIAIHRLQEIAHKIVRTIACVDKV
jgi:hypothetical protein